MVAFWKFIRSQAVSPRWLDDAKECIQSGWSKQSDCCSLAHEIPAANAGRFKSCISRKLFGSSTSILNGSSMECHDKKHKPFSLSDVRFGSRAIQFSWWKSPWRWSGRKLAFHPWLLLITCSNSQRNTHQIAQIRHFESQKFCNEFEKWRALFKILRKAWEWVQTKRTQNYAAYKWRVSLISHVNNNLFTFTFTKSVIFATKLRRSFTEFPVKDSFKVLDGIWCFSEM